ncbi:unnamed protein product [Tilletia controversa]|uniref:RlpA-like protein double-psi beta-barrel domain-containing protein n=3 Tax=Tilletia TaxID=13289 RepID=A0A8X7T0P9_9BASI|nr:hypothetical protein CF336_g237 [Tilletia laevis]KAE8206176.1 hypothetical protein CF328_g60 [Tilletia controversa]KAE8265566.1 hypothetical protein A4X03_0g176 [Tilletia caries]KAE8208872.1 hypothetical protein CF335_g92 [Tilletia laevis]KAE8255536.1 hypothetical protein A4X06_0g383 [Tilletia controversa]
MSSLCKSPLLLISTAIFLASANVAAAAAMSQGPLTPPSSPLLASDIAAFGDSDSPMALPHETHPEQMYSGASSDDDHHWIRSADSSGLGINMDYVPASSPKDNTAASHHSASELLSPPSSPPASKRHLNGFGSSQSGAQRAKNEVRAEEAIRHGTSNAPPRLTNRRRGSTDVLTEQVGDAPASSSQHNSAADLAERSTAKAGGSQSHGPDAGSSEGGGQAVSTRQESGLVRRRRYDGKGTYYRVGMGSCGWHNNSEQFVAAISAAQYHAGGYCGKQARVCHSGGCVKVKLVDECPGCNYGSLDLSPAAFRALAPMRVGVIDITWSFA